jgi:hypothetical protein
MLLIAWSMVHGLSTLMLEGKLERACGVEADAQKAVADAVFDQFEAMMRKAR